MAAHRLVSDVPKRVRKLKRLGVELAPDKPVRTRLMNQLQAAALRNRGM